jgi:hypothetical protein
MTTERKRAIITISATLIVGIVIGALTFGLWSRYYYAQRGYRSKTETRIGFERKLFEVIDADEQQVKVIQPIMKAAMAQVDSLQSKTDGEVRLLLDSLDLKMKSALREDQYKKFKQFVSKGRGGNRHNRRMHSRGNYN